MLAALPVSAADVPTIVTPKGVAILMLKAFSGRVIVERVASLDRGAGRAAMEMLCAAADKHGVTLELFAVPLEPVGGKLLSKRALKKFYRGFGFAQHGLDTAKMRRAPR